MKRVLYSDAILIFAKQHLLFILKTFHLAMVAQILFCIHVLKTKFENLPFNNTFSILH